jgi:hypothetical protein
VHSHYGGEDIGILGPLMDHRRSVENSGVGPRLGPFFLGFSFAQSDDGTGELVSTI